MKDRQDHKSLNSSTSELRSIPSLEPELEPRLQQLSDLCCDLTENQPTQLAPTKLTKTAAAKIETIKLGLKNQQLTQAFNSQTNHSFTASSLFSLDHPYSNLNNYSSDVETNVSLMTFQPALNHLIDHFMGDHLVDHFAERLEKNFRAKNNFSPKLTNSNNKVSSWKTIAFSSSLQLSPILEILLSHIPPFWQAELRLGLQEALVNAVKHGNQLDPQKQIKVSFSLKKNCYWWIIEDQGSDCNSNQAISEHLTQFPILEQDQSECGRGIYILQQIFNRVHWDHQKHHLYLFKQINPFDLPCIV